MLRRRSKESIASVAVRIGKAKIMSTNVPTALQMNMGIFMRVIPGQRILKMVTKKFTPERRLPIPAICTLHIQ
jgi:hypothetical protein